MRSVKGALEDYQLFSSSLLDNKFEKLNRKKIKLRTSFFWTASLICHLFNVQSEKNNNFTINKSST